VYQGEPHVSATELFIKVSSQENPLFEGLLSWSQYQTDGWKDI